MGFSWQQSEQAILQHNNVQQAVDSMLSGKGRFYARMPIEILYIFAGCELVKICRTNLHGAIKTREGF